MDTAVLRRAQEHIMSWASGSTRPPDTPPGTVATIVLADRRHLKQVITSGLLSEQTRVFVPGATATEQVIPYDGSLAEPGGEFCLGQEFYLQTQDYASSPYMTILGPTVVRIFEEQDFAAFLDDADRAHREGVFPEFLTAPSVLLADTSSLGGTHGDDGPGLRLYADHDGILSTSPGGACLGQVGENLAALTARYQAANSVSQVPCAVGLATVISEQQRSLALTERPWLGRYLAAVRALRVLATRNITGLKVSGFGFRMTAGLDAGGFDLYEEHAPLVLSGAGCAYVVAGGRLFSVGRNAAAAVECLIAAGEAATDFLPAGTLGKARDYFTDRGIHLGASLAGVR